MEYQINVSSQLGQELPAKSFLLKLKDRIIWLIFLSLVIFSAYDTLICLVGVSRDIFGQGTVTNLCFFA